MLFPKCKKIFSKIKNHLTYISKIMGAYILTKIL